jgi:hypothetical protein
LTERDSLNTDAIASPSDQVMKLMRDIEMLKKDGELSMSLTTILSASLLSVLIDDTFLSSGA